MDSYKGKSPLAALKYWMNLSRTLLESQPGIVSGILSLIWFQELSPPLNGQLNKNLMVYHFVPWAIAPMNRFGDTIGNQIRKSWVVQQ
jgi:hypothetical protein